MTLYEIPENLRTLMEQSDEMDEQTFADTLETLNLMFDEKAENIACLIKELGAEADAIKAEKKALDDREKSKRAKVDRLAGYLAQGMTVAGKTKLETPRAAISFRRSSYLDITDESALREYAEKACLLRYKDPDIDKTGVTALIKQGNIVPGAQMSERQNLQIK